MHARRKCLPMWPRRCGTQRLLVTAKLSCVVSRSSDAGRKALSSGLELTLWPLYTLYKHIHAFNIMQNKVGTYACLQQASYKMHCVTVNVTNTNALLHTYNESTDFILNFITLSFKVNKINLRYRVPLAAILEFERFAGEIDLQIEREVERFTLQ